MKEIMLPYVLICWLLVRLGVIQWTLKNAVRIVAIGLLIAFMLFTSHRFWSPADLTDSSTIKAPHAVLSPLFGQEIEHIYVSHNQKVKKGDLLYTLVSVDSTEQINGLKAQQHALRAQQQAEAENMRALKVSINNDRVNLTRLLTLDNFASQQDRDDLSAKIDANNAQVLAYEAMMQAQDAQIQSLQAEIDAAKWQDGRREIRAQHDGQLAITNISEGSRVGNLHLFDTSKKFMEMRIADQSYRHIKPGQFAEFYVNAYPGEIFRGRVHSITSATGEAMVSPLGRTQQVRQHVNNNQSNHGRTVVIEFEEPEGYDIPLGATGSAWISADKPHSALGFMDIIGAATVRLKAIKAYFYAV